MADSKPRKRSRAACLSCQSRKRKCSGEKPCATCVQSGVDCQYSAAPRKKRLRSTSAYGTSLPVLDEPQRPPDSLAYPVSKTVSTTESTTSPASFNRVGEAGVSHSLEVNSGAAFVRKLGLRIDPARAPRLHLFAWNVGERRLLTSLSAEALAPALITKLLPQEEMRRLAVIYFEKVDPCYSFLDRQHVFSRIKHRWEAQVELSEHSYDAVLYGVAAFGYLFSQRERTPMELRVVNAANHILQTSILGAETPSIDVIAGWVLRVAYLRMTASPHAGWMASCTLMHLIEAAGLHLESTDSDSSLLQGPSSQTNTQNNNTDPNTPDTRRRLFGMARHLNTWISFDLGRSRVVFHGATTRIIPQNPNRADLLHLLPLSESLDPTTSAQQDLPDLETALSSVLDLVYTEPSLILVQCNLMLCIYRRVRALSAHASLSTRPDCFLAIASRGLRAAREMVASTCPWHQVANVPFQVVCTLLAIDNRAALELLPDAMLTLREVVTVYDTDVMREAYSTAYLLVAMHQRRKEDDTRALGDVLRANSAAATVFGQQDVGGGGRSNGTVGGRELEKTHLEEVVEQVNAPVSDVEFSWLGDLVIDMPSLQNFDLDQFLMTDVPWPLPEMGI
ncbi:hypothetical protein N7494_001963 [Penicillium frequentans]|uniref:Zn(2)-C6 fungal-type domain-containing protein n=1 Tax=Penicillium frequentans TaxID=3151616 RepID=A0AAD6D2Z4_9EURO|nr:hypothetical protein N7494_001963 [Penicillium glabrum]